MSLHCPHRRQEVVDELGPLRFLMLLAEPGMLETLLYQEKRRDQVGLVKGVVSTILWT